MEQYHYNAAAWSWMQRQHYNEWTVEKLLDVWEIKPDKKDPKTNVAAIRFMYRIPDADE